MNRRTFVQLSGAAMLADQLWAADAKPGLTIETSLGKVRGLSIGKVNAFRGIRYGADTAGARRFLAPVKPAASTGVFDAFEWGPEAPQASPHGEKIGRAHV